MKIRSSSSLRDKLIKAVDSIPLVDVFGYEKKAEHNILAYTNELSKKIKIPQENIIIRIINDHGCIQSCTYRQGRRALEISMRELIRLFTGEYYNIEEKTEKRIVQLFKDILTKHSCDQDTLQLCVSAKNNKVSTYAVTKDGFVTEISLKQLIHYFF